MLNDHKTYPQFMCPNCRAMTDLEADVDDPLDDWDDADLDLDPINNTPTTPNPITDTNLTHDASPTHDAQIQTLPLTDDDVHYDLTTNRVVSHLHEDLDRHLNITNLNQDSEPSTSPLARSTIGASIHARRLASRPAFGVIGEGAPRSPQAPTSNTSADLTMDMHFSEQHTPWMEASDGEQISGSARGSRQVTPRGSGLLRTPTPPEIRVVHDGPLTPRNDAGPFVFDGSAGRGGN